MGYLIEIDDLSKRIIYPPRGMEFEPVSPVAATPDEVQPEPKPLWQQEELAFTFAENVRPGPPPSP